MYRPPMLRALSDRVHAAELRKKSGWSLGMHVIRLRKGEVLVHSPVRPEPAMFDAIEKIGKPTILFAPNHFHHMWIPRYRERFPDARVVAAAGARPRLEKKGHVGLVDAASEKLDGVRLIPCEHVKSGETMVVIDDDAGPTLLVCDAFFNVPGPLTGFEGWFLRVTATGPGLSLGRTFRFACIADKFAYADWLVGQLETIRPKRILFSHGEPLEGEAVITDLVALTRKVLGSRSSG